MELRKFGNTELMITPIGFGAWAVGGGGWAFGWGPQDDQESVAAMHRAIDHGINWIDTAAVYGLGHSEEVVARAVKGMTNKPYIFTKCGLVWDEKRNVNQVIRADSIGKECEASLKRLNVDVIDLYQIHWPVDEDIEEAWQMMAKLRKEGKIRYAGVSNFSVEQIKRCQATATVSSLQPPYSLISRDYEKEVLPYCLEQGIGTIVYSPMGAGMLTGAMTRERIAALPAEDWRKRNPAFNEPLLTRNLELAEILKGIAGRHGCSVGEVAIAWTLLNPAVTGAIVGGRSAAQVDGIIKGASVLLTDEDLDEIVVWG
jgi:aryl-alcohol dehydrogenase-like predicted oxidoreductase